MPLRKKSTTTKTTQRLSNKRVLLGVTGSVAAYKAADIARRLIQNGALVNTVMTGASLRFITPMLMESLTGRKPYTDMFEAPLSHIALPRDSDLLLIAPATANTIARMAHGLADDMLSASCLAFEGPVIVAPAMNDAMYRHPATVENLRALRGRGVVEVEPGTGPLACGAEGKGRMAEVEAIVWAAMHALYERDLAGRRVLVTAGPTREPLDAVRYISNRSSGLMGYELASEAALRGADVVLISGPSALDAPYGVRRVMVETAHEMFEAVRAEAGLVDMAIMAAAVADFRPSACAAGKAPKGSISCLELVANEDILKWMGSQPGRPYLVGFAAESGPGGLERAKAKLDAKGADLIVYNDVSEPGAGFEVRTNKVTIIGRDWVRALPLMDKSDAARAILDAVTDRQRV